MFRDIQFENESLGTIVEGLTRDKARRFTRFDRTHFGPDLRRYALPWKRGWLRAFGPAGFAQTHLANNGVTVGDLFLFFGWFRKVRIEQTLDLLASEMEVGRFYPRSGIRYPNNQCLNCSYLGLCLRKRALVGEKLVKLEEHPVHG